MNSHFILSRGLAMACAGAAATALIPSNSSAQTLLAADYATNSAYADGWQDTDNGGFGFSHWSFNGTYTSAVQHAMDTNSVHNQLGVSWAIFLPNGKAPLGQGQVDSPNDPQDGTDLSRAGRGFPPLQAGHTLTTIIDNPSERHFFNGYTINLITGGECAGYWPGCTGFSRLRVGTFEYFTMGRWYVDSVEGGSPSLFDTNTAAAGMRLEFTLTGPDNYRLVMTPLANPASAYTNFGTLNGSGPIDWIQFEHYNTDSDFFNLSGADTIRQVATNPKNTDFYIRSITISSNAVLPAFVEQPASRVLYPGRTARFKAKAIGSSLSYRWRKNGTNISNGGNISGVLTETLVLANVGAPDVAAYTLVVTNSLGSITSSPALLTLAQPTGTPYENAVLAANPVAHWRLNEFANPSTNPPAYDYLGGLGGTYGNASSNGFNGILGPRAPDGFPAFESTNRALRSTGNAFNSWVTVPGLDLNTNTVTMTAWIYPIGAQADWSGLLYTRAAGSAAGLHYGGAAKGTAGQLVYTWNGIEETWGFFSGLDVPSDQWSFVAAVIEPTQGTLYLYNTNGQSSATNTPITHNSEAWSGEARIGNDPNSVGRTFNGIIDEVAVFNRALSPTEILNLYHGVGSPVSPVTLAIARSGGNIVLSWPAGTLLEAANVSGPYTTNNATSPYTNTPSGARKFYRVVQ